MRNPSSAPARSRLMTAHALVWAVAGLTSAVYLGVTAFGPPQDTSATSKSDRALSADDQANATALARLSQSVRQIQDRLIAGDEQSHALLGRMASLEEKAALPVTGTQAAAGHESPQSPRSSGLSPQPTPALPSASITTGTILQRVALPSSPAPQAAEQVPATVPRATLAIQLTSATNLDALRLNWSLLSERHRPLLGTLQTRYRQAAGKPNAPFHLIAGPVRSTADAARICKELAVSGVTCRATSFTGEAL